MEEKSPSKPEEKPFSVLERFRQLKKEKEQVAPTPEDQGETQETPQTIFQASSSNGELKKEGFRNARGFGRPRGKRNFGDNSSERPLKRIAADLSHGQKEQDVGITEFIRSGSGFEVILKHRYTDFHVNEIDLEGKVVKLTSIEIPKDDEGSETLSKEENPTILSPEQWAALGEIVEKKLPGTVDKDVTDLSKEDRQRIHKAVKKRFGVQVFSNTNVMEGRKIMQIGYACGQKNYRFCSWPQGRPEYLHFVLYKENSDMTEAINVISKFTRIKPNKFGYAGTKDKRAVTSQQMCVRRSDVERFSKCSELRGIAVGNYSYKWNNLRLGDLNGNRFKLVLRHIKASDEVIKEAIEDIKKTGFLNYFGMQRFGQSVLVPTYLVGQAILKGDWKLATELILKPRPGEASYRDLKEAREIWWETRDATKALKPLTRKERSIEGKILTALKKHGPNAYQNAFDSLPRHTVTLYLHSYQSLVWNKIVSRRVREFGLRVLPGDLVQINPEEAERHAIKWQENTKCCDDESEEEDDDDDGSEGGRIQVRSLSAEEAQSASIHDVVYPLPGEDIKFPENEIAGWYTDIMSEDGHSMDCFKKVNRKYGMYGSYRKMIETVGDLNWYTLQYTDHDECLLLSDLDILKGKPSPVLDPDGPYKALIVEFNLNVCSYATMAIRELAKCETSVASQSMLTNQAREEDLAAKKLKREETHKMEVEAKHKTSDVNENLDDDCGTSKNDQVHQEHMTAKKEAQVVANKTNMEVRLEDMENCDSIDTTVKKDSEEAAEMVQMEVDSEETRTCDSGNNKGETSPKTPVEGPRSLDRGLEEMGKKEAELENIINKYLETNYH